VAERTEGWGSLDNARDAHYFKDSRSLCGRWLACGSPRWEKNQALGKEPTKGTRKACWKKRARTDRGAKHG
jgi:hypothetical protein